MLSTLVSIYFGSPRLGYTIETNCKDVQIVDSESSIVIIKERDCDKLFYFAYDFSRIICFMSYSINWPDSIVWWHLYLEILGNMCTVIIYFPVDGVTGFEINLSFLIKPLSYMTNQFFADQSQNKNLNIIKTKRSFK